MLNVILIPESFIWLVSHIPALIRVVAAVQTLWANDMSTNCTEASQTKTARVDQATVRQNRKSGKQTVVQQGHNVVLLFFFYLPFRRIQRPLWYSSHVFFRWAKERTRVRSRALLDCLFCFVCPTIPPRVHVDTHTNTHSLPPHSLYLRKLIAVIKQRAAVGFVWECSANFHSSEPCCVENSHFLHHQVTEGNEVTGKRGN